MKTKKRLKKAAVAVAVIVLLLGSFYVMSAIGTNANLPYAQSVAKVETENKLTPEIDKFGYWSFTKKEGQDFRILQLTDIHIGGGLFSIEKDNKAFSAVQRLVEYTKPDLIIVTGDMVYPVPYQSGSLNNLKTTKIFGEFMKNLGIPFAVVYGNHDCESYSTNEKSELSEYYQSLDNCLFQTGQSDITGEGNYIINVYNPDKSINTSLVLMDSNSYVKGEKINTYDNIHDDQIEWYESELKRISEGRESLVNSLAFFHIPLNEFADAWELYKAGSDEVTYHYGKAGEKGEKVYAPKYRGNMFDKIVELGSTKGIFCGHDHYNDFSVTYKGVRLTYGKSIDFLAYPGISRSTWQRGGTVISIADDASFSPEPLRLVDIPA